MTLEAWVYPTAAPAGWTSVLMKEQPGDLVYGLYSGSTPTDRPTAWGYVTTETGVTGTAALATNTWTHLAATFDGTTLRLYVNGVQQATQALAGSLKISTGALRIGGNAIWGRLPPPDRRSAHLQSGAHRNGNPERHEHAGAVTHREDSNESGRRNVFRVFERSPLG